MTPSAGELGGLVAAGALAAATAHLAYFPALFLAARRRPRPWGTTDDRFDGRLALLVPARDEEETIRGKLENLLGDPSLPPGSLVVVLADGCRDRTVEVASAFPGVRVDATAEPHGKGRRLEEAFATLPPAIDLVAVTDATSRWEPGTLGRLLEPLGTPGIGGAGAVLAYRAEDAAGTRTRAYFDFEARVRDAESRLLCATGFSGSLFVIRRSTHLPFPPGANDDFVAALDVAAAGLRAVVVPEARVEDRAHAGWRAEFRMRRRVVARALAALGSRGPQLVVRRPAFAAMLVAHKLLRIAFPFLLLLAVGGLATAATGSAPVGLGAILAAALLLALWIAFALRRPTRGGDGGPFDRWTHLALAQGAAMMAVLDLLGGRRATAWTPDRGNGRAA